MCSTYVDFCSRGFYDGDRACFVTSDVASGCDWERASASKPEDLGAQMELGGIPRADDDQRGLTLDDGAGTEGTDCYAREQRGEKEVVPWTDDDLHRADPS